MAGGMYIPEPHYDAPTNRSFSMCEGEGNIGFKQEPKPKTIGEVFDQRIESARKMVERLCVQKAKLEALQMLNHPYVEMRDLINGEMF
jgi:hypothetical protein